MDWAPVRAEGAGSGGDKPGLEKAIFAAGCFWCMEPVFDSVEGVVSVTPGYTGGHTKNPIYEEVPSGATGHAESVQQEAFSPRRYSRRT
jgi:peptide-methionine (S)-S-oxide reductase